MKKLILFLMAGMLLLPVTALSQARIDIEGSRRKIATSDADIQGSRASRAATWISRGDAYYGAAVAPIGGTYKGMGETEANLLLGQPTETKTEEVGNQAYTVWVYPHFDLYFAQEIRQVIFWKQKTVIVPNALDTAVEAYHKAVELDARQANRVKPLLAKVADTYEQDGDIAFSAGDYPNAATNFAKAYDLSIDPLVAAPDSMAAYNAGYVSVLAENFPQAQKYLQAADELGYVMDGELYFLEYHTYMGLKDTLAAEAVLKEGVQKFPSNSRLIESLIFHYTSTGQDASQMIPMVEEALQNDPNNFIYHFGLGIIYDKLNQFEKSIAEFRRAAELNPEDYGSVYNEGITYVRQAELMAEDLNAIPMNEQERYQTKLGEVNNLYRLSIPAFEKAHRINPQDINSIDLLKSLYFRFRDDSPEMMQNYEKYNALLQTMQ
jgi:tetratricopeptide (TPR) repeat protein